MDLRVLSYFLMVAREENVTRAAEQLHVTQPTLSRQLMQLEDELDTRLFERGSHKITLTEEGMLLRRRAEEILALTEKTKREVTRKDEILSGEIAIGSGELKSIRRLAGLAAEFHGKHPEVSFDLYSGNVDNVRERMDRGLVDLALMLEPVDLGKYEFMRMPETEKWGVVVRKDSALAKKDFVSPWDLADQEILLSGRDGIQSEVASWFGDVWKQLKVKVTFNLLYNAAAMVEQGFGAALALELDCSYPNLTFVPLEPTLELGSVLAWKKNQMLSPTVAAFIRYIRAHMLQPVQSCKQSPF